LAGSDCGESDKYDEKTMKGEFHELASTLAARDGCAAATRLTIYLSFEPNRGLTPTAKTNVAAQRLVRNRGLQARYRRR
jgi:hypothetical protein